MEAIVSYREQSYFAITRQSLPIYIMIFQYIFFYFLPKSSNMKENVDSQSFITPRKTATWKPMGRP